MLTRREKPRVKSRVSRSREDWSAQWTSSTTSRSGASQARSSRAAWTASTRSPRSTTSSAGSSGFGSCAARRDEPGEPGVGRQDAVEQVGRGALEPAEDLDEREVGQRLTGLAQAVPDQDGPAGLAGSSGDLGQDAGLADAGVSGQQHQAGAVGVASMPSSRRAGPPRRHVRRTTRLPNARNPRHRLCRSGPTRCRGFRCASGVATGCGARSPSRRPAQATRAAG